MIETDVHITPGHMAVEASGHSGYALKGADIVCSAFSILFFTLAQSLQEKGLAVEVTEQGQIKRINAYGHISLEHRVLNDYFISGVCMLAEKYPMYVAPPRLETGGINV